MTKEQKLLDILVDTQRRTMGLKEASEAILNLFDFSSCVKNNWIELSKEPPSIHSENYLVFKNGEIKISLFRGDWNMFHCDIYRDVNEPYVTHWMHLPDKPSTKD